MSAFIEAYREYLERMIDQSDDLVTVDQFTVPETVDTEGVITEWADVN
jgi:hypothetical protein